MTQISIPIDDSLKAQADSLFEELGLSLAGAFNIFVRQAVRQRCIPFLITAETDPFYNPANVLWIEQSIAQMQSGRKVSKTFDELERMAM